MMPNDRKYRFKNDCMVGNVLEFHLGKDAKPSLLLAEVRLSSSMKQHLDYRQQYYGSE